MNEDEDKFHSLYNSAAAAAAAKSLQPCLTLCDPINSSPPASSIPGILQARVLEWGAISFSYNITYLESKFYFTHFNYCYDYLSRLKELEK